MLNIPLKYINIYIFTFYGKITLLLHKQRTHRHTRNHDKSAEKPFMIMVVVWCSTVVELKNGMVYI